ARRVGAMDCAHLPPRQGWRVGKPGRPSRTFRPRMDEKRSTGVAFLLVTSLWPSKEKSPARLGGVRKKTRMSQPIASGAARHENPRRMAAIPAANPRAWHRHGPRPRARGLAAHGRAAAGADGDHGRWYQRQGFDGRVSRSDAAHGRNARGRL